MKDRVVETPSFRFHCKIFSNNTVKECHKKVKGFLLQKKKYIV